MRLTGGVDGVGSDDRASVRCYARGDQEATAVVIVRRVVIGGLLGLTVLAGLVVAGCGDDEGPVRVFAASSLQDVMPELLDAYAAGHPDGPVFEAQYGGSQALATQIELGAEVDLFLSANGQQVDRIDAAGLVERRTSFAANRLVIVVAGDSSIRAIDDLGGAGVRIAVGAPDVPVGELTRVVLDALDAELQAAILSNVVTEDPSVRIVLSRVQLGEVDAAFVYRTDLAATTGLRAIELPGSLGAPANPYVGTVLVGAKPGASELLDFLGSDEGQAILARAGFEVGE